MDLAHVMLLFLTMFLFDFDYHGISAQQYVEVVSLSSLIWKERTEVTCTFEEPFLAIQWKKTEEKALNSDNGEVLLSLLNGIVTGPGLSRGMNLSLSSYSLLIDNVMLQDSGYFWCKVTLGGGIGARENYSSSIVYNETEPYITATECGAGNDADFCVTEGEPITCKVFGLKPLNIDDIELTIDGEGIQGDQSQEPYEVIEDSVSYTFYNVERNLTTGSAADEAYTYNCKITTSAFEADAPPVKVLVSKGTSTTTSMMEKKKIMGKEEDDGDGLSVVAIIFIVIVVIVVIALIIALIIYCVCYKKEK